MNADDRESIRLLQEIDCNCNNCIHMHRDLATQRKWEDIHRRSDEDDFDRRKAKAIAEAEAIEDPKMRAGQLFKARKMRFQFDRNQYFIKYGDCVKFNKPVSFIPATCQIETQQCFQHR